MIDFSILSIMVAIVVAGVFGWMVLSGVLPTNEFVSWEGHLCGLAAGAVAAIIVPGSVDLSGPERARRMER